jgi:hypothetical protein
MSLVMNSLQTCLDFLSRFFRGFLANGHSPGGSPFNFLVITLVFFDEVAEAHFNGLPGGLVGLPSTKDFLVLGVVQ